MNPRRRRLHELYANRALVPFDGSTNATDVMAEVNLVEEVARDRTAWICDVGCGRGWHLSELRRRGFENLVGVDLSLNQLVCTPKPFREISLVCADVFRSPLLPVFDVVTAFLCCLGGVGAEAEAPFVEALGRLLRPCGAAVISLFTTEMICDVVGEFDVTYDSLRPERVQSSVYVKRLWGKQFLCITQRATGLWSGSLREVLQLPTRGEVEALLVAAGFARVTWIDGLPGGKFNRVTTFGRGRRTLIAWRSAENEVLPAKDAL